MSVPQTSKHAGQAWPDEPANRLALFPADLVSPWRQRLARRNEAWLALLAASEALRTAAAHDRNLPARCQAPYISRAFDLAARHEIVDAHYRFVQERFPARMRSRLLGGRDVRIAHFAYGQGEQVYLHMRAPALHASGELGLYLLVQDKRVLSSCTLTFAGRRGLLIGALHGSWSFMGKQPIRAFTRAAHGLRPKNLLLSLVYAFARHAGLGPLRAASDAARPAAARKHWLGAGQDAFWLENGGRLDAEGFYVLPDEEWHRPPEQVPSKRRAARRRREAFRADACEHMVFAFRYALPSAPPDPAPDGTEPTLRTKPQAGDRRT